MSSGAARIICPNCQSRFPNPHNVAEMPGNQEVAAVLAEAPLDGARPLSNVSGCLSAAGVLSIPFGFMLLILALTANWQLGLAFLGGLIWLGLMSTGIMMWQTRDRPEERSVGRAFTGMLVLVGILALSAFALVIVLLVACTAGLWR